MITNATPSQAMSYYTDRSLPVLDVPVTLDSSQTFASAPWLENSSCGPWTDDVGMQVTKLRRPPSSNDRGFRGFLDFLGFWRIADRSIA